MKKSDPLSSQELPSKKLSQNISKAELKKLIGQFTPLNKISIKYHPELVSSMTVQAISSGKIIFKKNQNNKNPKLLHFLVSGEVEIRESFDRRYPMSVNQKVNPPLETLLPKSGSVRALEDCQILVVNNLLLDQLLSLEQDYTVHDLNDDELSLTGDTLIDDDFHEDWDNVFLRSHLSTNLPSTVIHQVISQLEDIEVNAGDLIVKAKSTGDYFYIVKNGTAVVETTNNGPFKGVKFPIDVGQYFGDEALVAGTPRNADVTMETDGILGRLDIEKFNTLIKPHLVPVFDNQVANDSTDVKMLDVRFSAEYQQGHIEGSDNIPICYLRQQMAAMTSNSLYVIAPANDQRAELATYIMRQAGYKAYQQSAQFSAINLA